MDAASARPVVNTEVRVHSDNGIRCVSAPCPTNGKEWKRRTDARGYLIVPRAMLQRETSITTQSHTVDLVRDADRAPNQVWVVDVIPRDLADGEDLPSFAYHFVAAGSWSPIANTVVTIHIAAPAGNADHVDVRTNARGFVFIPYEVLAFADDEFWVTVPGYRRTRVAVSRVQQRVVLQQQ